MSRLLPLLSWLAFPIYVWQGLAVRRRAPRLLPPEGPVLHTLTGRGEPVRLLVLGDSSAASVGIDDSSVANAPRAAARLLEQRQAGGGEWFAERFLAGREFNVSLLAHADRAGAAEVLPVAEIRFDAYPPAKPRIVGYAAKWQTDSFEYAHTPRSFAVNEEDPRLAGRLGEIALACWRAFGLAGYARVDCRLDAAGAVHVLEVNANPCLAPDAGFAAACAQAGIGLDGALLRIVDAALMEPAPSAATAAAPGA